MLKQPATKKETNPKDAVGVKKVPFSTLSMQVLGEMGLGMLEGARKYGRHNFRSAGVRASVYFDAAMRHLADWYEGQDIDPTSGLHHITKLLTTAMVLRDSMLQDNWVDDRPPRAANQRWLEEQNQHAAEIIERFPEAMPAHTQLEIEDTVRNTPAATVSSGKCTLDDMSADIRDLKSLFSLSGIEKPASVAEAAERMLKMLNAASTSNGAAKSRRQAERSGDGKNSKVTTRPTSVRKLPTEAQIDVNAQTNPPPGLWPHQRKR